MLNWHTMKWKTLSRQLAALRAKHGRRPARPFPEGAEDSHRPAPFSLHPFTPIIDHHDTYIALDSLGAYRKE